MAKAPFILNTSPIDAETREIAERELNETPERCAEAVEELRQLLRENTDLYFSEDDQFLITILRPCHFYPKSAIKLLRKIAEFKKEHASTLKDLMPDDEYSAFCENEVVNVLTNFDQHGRRVLIVHCGSVWDPKKVSSEQLFRIFYLVHLAALVEEHTQVRGVVVIMDFSGLGMKQIKSLTPSWSRRLLTFIQEAMPVRLKQVHIVNQPFVFNMVWTLFKPFVQDKLSTRMFFHGNDRKKLHQHISPTHLPADYGGELPALNYSGKDWFPCVKDHEEHIRLWNTYGFASSN